MVSNALAPPSPQLDALLDPPVQGEKRTIKSRLSDQFQRVRGRSPSPRPSGESMREEPVSPSKKLGVSKLLRRSINRARSTSPGPSRSSVVYDTNAPEYYMPELPNWQLYDGSSTQLGAAAHNPPPASREVPEGTATEAVFEEYADDATQHAAAHVPAAEYQIAANHTQQPIYAAPAPVYPQEAPLFGHTAHRASRSGIPAAAFGRQAERESVIDTVVTTTTEVASVTANEPLVPSESALEHVADATADATVIDYEARAERTHPYEPTVPHAGKPWKSYEDEDEDEEGAGRLYRRRMAEPVPVRAPSQEKPAPARGNSGDSETKQERLLSAMQKAPEGAGLTDLMNRVVQPGRQSWLRGIWPSDGSREASEGSQRSASGGSQGGVIFQGADASPSLYSTSSMDRFSADESMPPSRNVSGEAAVERGPTAMSRGSSHQSDDEREAFERKRRSMLEARRILEQEKRQGSADFKAIEAPPPVPSKDTPRPEYTADQEAEWRAQQEAAWYAQQEAEWHAYQEAEWHAQQEAAWYAQQEAEWHAYQEAEWRAQQEAQLHQHGMPLVETVSQGTPMGPLMGAPLAPMSEPDAPMPPAKGAPAGFRTLGKRKAPPSSMPPPPAPAARPMSMPPTNMPPPPVPAPKVAPMPEPATPASTVETVVDEDGRRMRPDGFGGFVTVFDDDDDRASMRTRPESVAETPKAPQVASMQQDFTRADERPSAGIPSPSAHFQQNLPGLGSPPKRPVMLSPRPPARPTSPPSRIERPLSAPVAPASNAPFQVAAEVYTTPASMQGSVGRMTWTPEMAEAAAKYIQTMTTSASGIKLEGERKPSMRLATELAVPAGMAPSRSVVEQLQARGVDLVLDAGDGIEPKDMPVQQALQEMMVRFYLYERHSVPILKELDKRLVALEHWSLLERQADARQPAWNEEAVARIASEVRREMRGLMAGIKELHECRLQLQSLTHETSAVHKRKRPTSMSGPDKRIASEANSVRIVSDGSTVSAASAASKDAKDTLEAPDTPKVPHSPLAALAGLGPRPYSPAPFSPMQSKAPEAKPVEMSNAKADESQDKAATVPTDTKDAAPSETEAKADNEPMPKAESAETVPSTESDAPATPSTPVAPTPLYEPVAKKPVYTDRAAESGLLSALMRANERAHTPPPPTPRMETEDAEAKEAAAEAAEAKEAEAKEAEAREAEAREAEAQAAEAREAEVHAKAQREAEEARKEAEAKAAEAAEAKRAAEAAEATAKASLAEPPSAAPLLVGARTSPSHARIARTPMADVDNVPQSVVPPDTPKTSTHASSALRARAQRYLKASESGTIDTKTPAPAPEPTATENVSPSKPAYQPSALSESLRRRMAKFEPAA